MLKFRLGNSFSEWANVRGYEYDHGKIKLGYSETDLLCKDHSHDEDELVHWLKEKWSVKDHICFIEAKKRKKEEEDTERDSKRQKEEIEGEDKFPIPLSPTIWWLYLYVNAGTPDFEQANRIVFTTERKNQFPNFSIEDAKEYIRTNKNKNVEMCWQEIFPVLFSNDYLNEFIEAEKEERLQYIIDQGQTSEKTVADMLKHHYKDLANEALSYEIKWFNLRHWPFYHGKDGIFDALDVAVKIVCDRRIEELKNKPYIRYKDDELFDIIRKHIGHIFTMSDYMMIDDEKNAILKIVKKSLREGVDSVHNFLQKTTEGFIELLKSREITNITDEFLNALGKDLESLRTEILDNQIEKFFSYQEEGFYPPCTTSISEIAFTTARQRAEKLEITPGRHTDNHFNDRILSCNNSILGNWPRAGESTFYYVILSRNIHSPLSIFKKLDFVKRGELEAFKNAEIYLLKSEAFAGRLDMHFIPWNKLNRFAYLSKPFGYPIEDSRNFTVVLEDLWSQTLKAVKPEDFFNILLKLHSWQSRLVDICYSKFGKNQGIQRHIIHSDVHIDEFENSFSEYMDED